MASPCSSIFHSATQSSPEHSEDAVVVSSDSTSSHRSPLDPLSPFPTARICDVYLGCSGRRPLLRRFVDWLRAELEMQGVRCFASDRRRCRDAYTHAVSRAAMDSAAVGMVVLTGKSFSNAYAVEEMRWFLERKKLIPVFFGLAQGDCAARDIVEKKGEIWQRLGGRLWMAYGGVEGEWKEAVDGASHSAVKLEVNAGNFRNSIFDALRLLGTALARRSMVEKVERWRKLAVGELPFSRNANFVGRKSELAKLELLLFGDIQANPKGYIELRTRDTRRRHIDMDRNNSSSRRTVKGKVAMKHDEIRSEVWKESEEEIVMQCNWRRSELHASHQWKKTAPILPFQKGVACVCGDSGMGKTELLLEFAYRFSQNYKMVFWVGGESRYLRQNYLNLLPMLGVDVTIETEEICWQRNSPRSFEEIEADAIWKVRRELMRGIPFLLVIDNLESEEDWWDGRNIMEILPRFGGETHILISSCLPQILNIQPLRLSYLSAAEAMILMKGRKTLISAENSGAFRIIEEKLGRVPLGLAIAGAILSELPIDPPKLLDAINQMPYKEPKLSRKEDLVLRHNPGLIQLLDACFSILDNSHRPRRLAKKMVEASNWFAPSPIPISMLSIAASSPPTEHCQKKFWRRCLQMLPCTFGESDAGISGAEVSSDLIRLAMARSCTRTGYISFHRIIKVYACARENDGNATMIIRAIENEGNLQQHAMHVWAACFLLFKFGSDPGFINLSTRDLLSFIKCFVLPLASFTFAKFSNCNAALELLRVSAEALEGLEDSFSSEITKDLIKTICFMGKRNRSSLESNQLLYQDLVNLRAILLETRAKFLLQGGQYDIGEQLCRAAVSIKEVIYGYGHPQTQATCEIMERLLRLQSKF